MSLRVIEDGSSNAHLLQERNYLGLPYSTEGSCKTPESKLNLKATELRLGLPGSRSPERSQEIEKPFFPLHPIASVHSLMRNKRGFSDAMDEVKHGSATDAKGPSQEMISEKETEVGNGVSGTKAQVVGWPPIRSFRRNSLVASRNAEEGEKGTLFVKVSMDGAPYLRKVDLVNYGAYRQLSSALEKMFGFTLGQYGPRDAKMPGEGKLKDGPEYVLTYEDKDGDWMLVGDVPWPMFIETCRKLRIMKSSDAIGLAPRSAEKAKFQS